MLKQVSEYGSWRSPISSDIVAASSQLTSIALDEGSLYWRELRPEENGRYTILCRGNDGHVDELTHSPINVRTLVHEYGGGDFLIHKGVLYFSNFTDQQIYSLDNSTNSSRQITRSGKMRYADGCFADRLNCIFYVREDHTISGSPQNTIVSVNAIGDENDRVVVSGNDFYSSPRVSPDGRLMAWLTWNHPNMPWDGTELWLGSLGSDGTIHDSKLIAGGLNESVLQPNWSPDSVLHFVSDRTGWWNIYRWKEGRIQPLVEMEAEFGRPHWVFGISNYAFESSDQLFCAYTAEGRWRFGRINLSNLKFEPIDSTYTEIASVEATPGKVCFIGGSPTQSDSIVEFDTRTRKFESLYSPQDTAIDKAYLSVPKAIEFPTDNRLRAYGFYYEPTNRDFEAPPGELPPLIVYSHGGPTSATRTSLSAGIQFWTSRGFAVVDVNYGGSTGYGRAYRERLNGNWGIVDVQDCVNAAKYLSEEKLVNASKLAIRGGSAGGYVTLCAVTFYKLFKAGASYFGVSDMELLFKETHKFESQYNIRMIGPYPERRDLYVARSPIHFADKISCPMIILQGLEDKIVTPDQAEVMVQALRAKGIPFAYVTFEGEQHGFRRKENVKRAIEAEFYFYSKIFHFRPADELQPVEIENLKPELGK